MHVNDFSPASSPARGEPVIRLRGASFGYSDRRVVTGVDLDIRAGETVALLGANGSGKSTLVKGLLGIADHLGGDVDLFGTPQQRFTRRYLIGYVPQRHTLSASVTATVTEIVSAGRLPHQGRLGWMRREDRRIVAQAIDLVGLGSLARHDVATLSGGQQRRVLIARALAAQPQVLVMDEPTAGVDIANQGVLVRVLRRLVDEGVTLLVVTHELEALRPVLARAVTMHAGRIVADGSLQGASAVAADAVREGSHGHCHDTPEPETGSLLLPEPMPPSQTAYPREEPAHHA